jgi:polyisoprenoid-binding protein YceI
MLVPFLYAVYPERARWIDPRVAIPIKRAGGFMRNTLSVFAIVIALSGCKNPGADVAPAKVEATPEAEAKAAPATPIGSLSIDPSNTKIEFVGAKVTRSHDGGFTDFSGKLDLAEPVEQSQIEITIQTESLYADEEKLTKHLKSPDFFDVE